MAEALTDDEKAAALALWTERLRSLVAQVKGWAEGAGWRTRTVKASLDDRVLGKHSVPVLFMGKDTVEVALNPVSPRVPGAEGAVDLYLMPAFDDIASLYFEGGRWVVYYPPKETAPFLPDPKAEPLSEELIVAVLGEMASHAA